MREITTTVYKFNELSDRAKERARDWFREGSEFDGSDLYDDFESVAEILGITFDTRSVKLMGGGTRTEPKIWWTGFSSQGDGACFEGSYQYNLDCTRKIRSYAPQDEKLHQIADALVAVQRKHFFKLTAKMSHSSSHYYHKYTMDVQVYRGDNDADDETTEAVRDAMRDFAEWIYRSLEKEYEYRMSDEAVDEDIMANEYEFEADGTRARHT